MVQRYAHLSADHLAQWVTPLTAGPCRCQLQFSCNETMRRTEKTAESLTRLGAPGWDRTSNPCLRRAVLYPLSYGRL